ncbi:hypothetical protein M3Y94_00146400 [Aphelenchoides besseyi]|nr:hypothetical protein M3Y94_00146400 [Aphelenchoides besseyi]KAI6237194.1 hypothetical protein M3Y95_00239600 [Aphelenchoides besseyi]
MRTLISFVLLVTVTSVVANSNTFWISINVRELTYQPECITDRNCDAMTLSLLLDSNSDEGTIQSSWKMEDVMEKPLNSEMTATWHNARLTNITLKTLLTAKDVLFDVQRPCDQSASPLHIFAPIMKASPYNAPNGFHKSVQPNDFRVLGLVGKCFNVIVDIRLFTERCPWCEVLQSDNANQNEQISFSASSLRQLFESPVIVGVIFGLLLLSLSGLIICTVMLRRAKQSSKFVNQYSSSNGYPGITFGRNSAVSSIPMPPMLRPPMPTADFNAHYGGAIKSDQTPYYETLDNIQNVVVPRLPTTTKHDNYDSAFDQSCGNSSPNSSFTTQHQNSSDSGRSSPHLVQSYPRAEYV